MEKINPSSPNRLSLVSLGLYKHGAVDTTAHRYLIEIFYPYA